MMTPEFTRIDTHQHFWDLARARPFWLTPELPQLKRTHLPADVSPEMAAAGIQAAVAVQADATLDEALWMLELARQFPWIVGVVGWVDLAATDVAATLEALTANRLFKGVRPHLDARSDFATLRPGLQALNRHRLTCDLLLAPQVFGQYLWLAAENPEVVFIFDHLGDPFGVPGGLSGWKEILRPIAALPNIAMKVSGYLTAANPKPLTPQVLAPYLETALELFGSQRLMFGSDWPICILAEGYAAAVAMLKALTSPLSASEQADIWGATASRVYKLD